MSEMTKLTKTQVDAGADALRRHAYRNQDQVLVVWDNISRAQKAKWREKALVALRAAGVDYDTE